jgi:TPR repeat protein
VIATAGVSKPSAANSASNSLTQDSQRNSGRATVKTLRLSEATDARSPQGPLPMKRTAYKPADVSTHLNVTDPLSAYQIQSLDCDSIDELMSKAESGDAEAELQLGSAYELGRGVPQNCEMAAEWIMKAASQGNAAAQYNLGLRYAQGDGVAEDRAESNKWLKKATEQSYLARRALYETVPPGE